MYAQQSDVTAKIIDAFEWFFLSSILVSNVLADTSFCLAGLHILTLVNKYRDEQCLINKLLPNYTNIGMNNYNHNYHF